MKKLNSGLLLITAAFMFTACGNDKTTEADTTNTSTMSSDNMTTNAGNMDSGMSSGTGNMSGMSGATPDLTGANGPTTFATTAASGGMMEVEAARTAQNSASSNEVKSLATMILNDHTQANAELKRIAQGKNITIPTSMMPEHQSHIDMLKNKSGADFDRAYLDMMEQDHMKDINLFQQASNSLTDSELKAFASKTLPVLQKHYERVKATKGNM